MEKHRRIGEGTQTRKRLAGKLCNSETSVQQEAAVTLPQVDLISTVFEFHSLVVAFTYQSDEVLFGGEGNVVGQFRHSCRQV